MVQFEKIEKYNSRYQEDTPLPKKIQPPFFREEWDSWSIPMTCDLKSNPVPSTVLNVYWRDISALFENSYNMVQMTPFLELRLGCHAFVDIPTSGIYLFSWICFVWLGLAQRLDHNGGTWILSLDFRSLSTLLLAVLGCCKETKSLESESPLSQPTLLGWPIAIHSPKICERPP